MDTSQTMYIRKRMFQENRNTLIGFKAYEKFSLHRIGCIRVVECDGVIFISSSLCTPLDRKFFTSKRSHEYTVETQHYNELTGQKILEAEKLMTPKSAIELADLKWKYCHDNFAEILRKDSDSKMQRVYVCRNRIGLLPTLIHAFDFDHILDIMGILQPLRTKWLFTESDIDAYSSKLEKNIPVTAKLEGFGLPHANHPMEPSNAP